MAFGEKNIKIDPVIPSVGKPSLGTKTGADAPQIRSSPTNKQQRAPLKIGTRGSPLALAQANHVKAQIEHASNGDIKCEIKVIKTSGDAFLGGTLRDIGGKGLFTKEIEEALQKSEIDLAVHSMKDVPVKRQAGLELSHLLPREDVRDAFISFKYASFKDLPQCAHVGTASLRREAQLRKMRPDLRISVLRGNVQTRMERVKEGKFDATLLALAGLRRLGKEDASTYIFPLDEILPAPAQGAIGIEIRTDTKEHIRKFLDQIHCKNTHIAVTAERAFLEALDGDCRTPIAAYAKIDGNKIHFKGQVLSPNGLQSMIKEGQENCDNAYKIGYALGTMLKAEFYKEDP